MEWPGPLRFIYKCSCLIEFLLLISLVDTFEILLLLRVTLVVGVVYLVLVIVVLPCVLFFLVVPH